MFGHSLIVAPTGEIAAKTTTEEDEVICFNCDIDLAQNLKQRCSTSPRIGGPSTTG